MLQVNQVGLPHYLFIYLLIHLYIYCYLNTVASKLLKLKSCFSKGGVASSLTLLTVKLK